MKQTVVYQEKCTACRECEMACSFSHEGTFNPSLSRIRVNDFYEEQFYLPMVCVYCADAPCAAVCPTVAIQRQPDGQVQVLAERCIGCKMCLLACPFPTSMPPETWLRSRIFLLMNAPFTPFGPLLLTRDERPEQTWQAPVSRIRAAWE